MGGVRSYSMRALVGAEPHATVSSSRFRLSDAEGIAAGSTGVVASGDGKSNASAIPRR